jgi:very-short-patch-repair endonuclease
MLHYKKELKQRSRDLRKNTTDAERKLWSVIRMKQIHGLQFYRQKPIGNYIVDFYCPAAKLVIEVDGGQHYESGAVQYDRIREDFLKSQGLRVIRFTNLDVLKNIEGVVSKILETTDKKIPL